MLLLLGLRRKGPGLWWTALCVAMALGVTLGPATIESISAPTAGGEVIRSVRPWDRRADRRDRLAGLGGRSRRPGACCSWPSSCS